MRSSMEPIVHHIDEQKRKQIGEHTIESKLIDSVVFEYPCVD